MTWKQIDWAAWVILGIAAINRGPSWFGWLCVGYAVGLAMGQLDRIMGVQE